MIWSISSFKEFQKCERKWFLDKKFSSRSPKNIYRQEVYFLSQLETIDAWRGQIVDYTLSKYVIPKMQKRQTLSYDAVIDYAKKITKARYEFAIAEGHKEPNLKKTEHYYEYAPLYDIKYPSGDLKPKLRKAWDEIVVSLTNFYNNQGLIADLKKANYLITQRTLQYDSHDTTIRGVPDLIAFYPDAPPHIYDWKVHSSDTKTYTEQLLIYAQSLITCWSHSDFEEYIKGYKMTDIRLSEFQLLTNKIRNYSVTEDYVERINDYIAGGIEKLILKNCHKKFEELSIDNFEKTPNLDNCRSCPFKKICKED
ncbi:MAG: PD-(D/E)XK nuclease family protein [Chitinophagaceae bacterium]|nr:PD-(D/E)XK nuclease family protein [Chitinophagaceae bacterium]